MNMKDIIYDMGIFQLLDLIHDNGDGEAFDRLIDKLEMKYSVKIDTYDRQIRSINDFTADPYGLLGNGDKKEWLSESSHKRKGTTLDFIRQDIIDYWIKLNTPQEQVYYYE